MKRVIRIGTRESALALAQTRLVADAIAQAHPDLGLELVPMKALGDMRPDLPLEKRTRERNRGPRDEAALPGNEAEGPGKALFTGRLEEALVNGDVDICVHSLKDMSATPNPDMPILGMVARGDPRDCLVLRRGEVFTGFGGLKSGSVAGSSSSRRRMQLGALAPVLGFGPIRGNVPTRIEKLDRGEYALLVLAAAGLQRLGLLGRVSYFFPPDKMVPAAGQGVLAIQGLAHGEYGFLDAVRDPVTEEEAGAELHCIREISGKTGSGCGSPAAAYARISGSEIRLLAFFARDEESPFFTDEVSGPRENRLLLAEKLAAALLGRAGF